MTLIVSHANAPVIRGPPAKLAMWEILPHCTRHNRSPHMASNTAFKTNIKFRSKNLDFIGVQKPTIGRLHLSFLLLTCELPWRGREIE